LYLSFIVIALVLFCLSIVFIAQLKHELSCPSLSVLSVGYHISSIKLGYRLVFSGENYSAGLPQLC